MSDLFAVTEATWPAAAFHKVGPFLVREGKGGGQRVSAATAEGDWTGADIDAVEVAQKGLGQHPLFMIRPDDTGLDAALAARGYTVKDPVNLYEAPVSALLGEVKRLSAFTIWPPLAIMRDIWAEGGIGPDRIAVMERAKGPKTTVLGRVNDRASGAAYIAIHGKTAMLHALHIVPDQRRQGSAVNMMREAAKWAQDHGAERFSVLVVQSNNAAIALYTSLNMQLVGHYHYRSYKP
ncbi:GNAT family N-acetyltransferase [Defluviimonas sp. WL0050]|uniref:GNAT family N-acetyltransferase n=1 Tax=Albidovulum litorale TaxID=2984134 RepID=A0ABT2ZLV1_9RHOB|nr:GNAT family N-acetyltransferase [Defluviimonas sp. WL0050]MCV2872115.1 GNAT family N-acetyltransferase [Defluviimonas sp. WL0050]